MLDRSGSQILGWSEVDLRGCIKASEDPHLYLNLILRTSSLTLSGLCNETGGSQARNVCMLSVIGV